MAQWSLIPLTTSTSKVVREFYTKNVKSSRVDIALNRLYLSLNVLPMKPTKRIVKEASNLPKSFARKIKTTEELLSVIGNPPRSKKVVMCHGTYDIVHPGHVRQLIYAKTKGDILIVNVQADKYVTNRPVGPYVPQELRTLNLAAFEIVDYVILDSNPTPIEHILKIKPDYYIKGYEYSVEGMKVKTREEMEALGSYGGQVIFSPGDIYYSTESFLSSQKPNLSYEQLSTLMSAEGITFELLKTTISKFKKISVHVIGDLIIDRYSKCTILGPAQKSPAFSVRLDSADIFVGGAGIVAKHLKELGADVTFTTVVGNDDSAKYAQDQLKLAGIKVNAFLDPSRPTTTKERFFTERGQLILQVDKVDNSHISDNLVEKICKVVENVSAHAIVFSDFRHGIFNTDSITKITWAIPPGCIKVADSQVSNRWGNILDFAGFDLITPNEREARFALGDQDTTIRPLAQLLYNKARSRYLILKLGENGIMTYRSPGMEVREFFYIDSFVDNLVDPIGAGDALLATATSSLVTSKNIVVASILGSLSAAIECSRLGNNPVTANELLERTKRLEKDFE